MQGRNRMCETNRRLARLYIRRWDESLIERDEYRAALHRPAYFRAPMALPAGKPSTHGPPASRRALEAAMFRNPWVKWSLTLLFWMLLAVIATSFSYSYMHSNGKHVPWSSIARRQFVSYFIWGAVLTPIVLAMCRRYPVERNNWGRMLLAHLGAGVGVAGLHALLRVPLHPLIYPGTSYDLSLHIVQGYFLANGYDDLWMYTLVACGSHGWRYYGKYRDRELHAAHLETQLARAELQMLKMQLQPHFLFNTLHSISTLMHRDSEAADRMITRLADLLRVSLQNTGIEEVTLKREMEFLTGYLEIEQTRFQDRLTVRMEIDPAALDACVPNLLLQPLVENAIRHGIARRAGPGTVEIWGKLRGRTLVLGVRDDGPGMAGVPRTGSGVGLTNTQARLEHLYGRDYRFDIVTGPTGGLEVRIEIPFRAAETQEQIANKNFAAANPIPVASSNALRG